MASAQALKTSSVSKESSAQESEPAKTAFELVPVKDQDGAASQLWWETYEEPKKPIALYSAHEVGRQGEMLACRYLSRRGFEIVEQNWRVSDGEVDIVARDENDNVVLVEVKTRLSLDKNSSALPELAVDTEKQRRYRKLALVYLMLHPDVRSLRFDVIAINIHEAHAARLRHLVGAFSWDS